MTTLSLRLATSNSSLRAPEALLGAAFVLYASVGAASFYWLGYLATLVLAYFVGRQRLNDRRLWVIFGVLYFLSLLSAIPVGPWGVYGNPNILGCFTALMVAGCLVYRLWLFLPFCAIGLLLAGSLTGYIASAAAVGLLIWRMAPWIGYCFFLLCLTSVLAFGGHGHSFVHRLGIWHDTMSNLTPFGAGLGSFAADYAGWPFHINMFGLAPHAYNDFLELTYSFGIGAVLLWFFIALHLESPDWRNRLIFFTFIACGLSFFPAFLPGLGHIGALTLGRLRYGSMAPRGPALPLHPWL